ncbi:RHS repeat-associated core domain-containing protein, partial [Acinetobacter sp. ULE_I057]|uniref:RHS repeat-associated core domain-containing protein n=1 Tax=Acinetobacter sp. ULE_I057 TaxID=3373070 RepID=UPI003AF54831
TAVLRYEYDELGNLTQTIRPDGQVQANLSYGSGHIYGIAFNKQDMVAFQRDDLHRETTRLLANGLVQTKNYNDVGLLSSQVIRPEQETTNRVQFQAERHYHYDNNYLLTQVDDSRLGKLNYQYDPIGRLIKSQNPYKSESFSFDPAGNLIDPIATQAAQVKNNLISQYQGKHYKYDAQGNVIETTQAGQPLKLTWDNLNRLIQSDNNGQITDYGYDVFGRRLFKNNHQDQSLTLFGWDGDQMVWESVKSSKVQTDYTKHYVYEPNSFVPLLQTGYTGFIKLIETPDYRQFQNVPYSIYKDPVWKTETRKNKAELERVAFYHCDQVGTPQTLSNELGECVWEIKQDTWGTALEINTSDNLLEQTNLRFQGQYYDKETGLHYNRYRYYEPYSARYVSKDPIGLFGGLHSTKYVSDPNKWIDPLGLVGFSGKEVTWTLGPVIYGNYNLTSQCIDKYQVNLEIDAVAMGVGGASVVPAGRTSGGITFFDNNSTIYPNNLNGAWGGAAVEGSVVGKGVSWGGKALGVATTDIQSDNGDATTNAAIGTFLGKVVRVKEKWSFCGVSEKPACGPGGCFDKKRAIAAPGFSPAQLNRPTVKEVAPEALKQQPPINININGL